ncbi:hypothetical protein GQ42DRAFT_177482 [Ramicandelaber brevisporus]|nr:hypothetical protein GQ42DRAFT_177482 [Ramicandelaber brevisporus]
MTAEATDIERAIFTVVQRYAQELPDMPLPLAQLADELNSGGVAYSLEQTRKALVGLLSTRAISLQTLYPNGTDDDDDDDDDESGSSLDDSTVTLIEDSIVKIHDEIQTARTELETLQEEIGPDGEEHLKEHMQRLHEYNAIKDVGQALFGQCATMRGVRTVDIYRQFNMDTDD